ncbi:protein translocase subunit SecF [Nocardioides terrisoli]|uniref:protein translocase subunit SecF n=1 Tax=Nocardioides terrisoli TaxID=3388267 RepID=UPI00287BC4D1|nr:protein translocase subunit SecF [Nocardioides marmorisolisilvae]
MGKFSRLGNDLYNGHKSIDFVGRRWLWYALSGVIIIAAIVGLSTKGLNLGIEFKGGTEYNVTVAQSSEVTQANVDKLISVVKDTGVPAAATPTGITNGRHGILITVEQMSQDQSDKVITAIANAMHIAKDNVSEQVVGASWGSQVAQKALTGLIVFLILVMLFIWGYFREWKMSVGAVVALAHDIVITVGIYSLSGFQVTPATVTGLLTILGFSLYDTVVVFDKVRENTRNLHRLRRTYAQQANLAVNQTLVRSINTSIVALLPVAALLIVGIVALGSGDLKDLALSLFVGMAAGAYSSIFIATPLVVQLKEREKSISEQDRRAQARQRRDADRYANVPVFTEELGIDRATLAGTPTELADVDYDDEEVEPSVRPSSPPRRPEATGAGRVVPESKAPLRESGSAKRVQPSRQPRSKRGK